MCLDLCPVNKICDECFQNPIKEQLFAGPSSPVTEVCSFVPMLFHDINIYLKLYIFFTWKNSSENHSSGRLVFPPWKSLKELIAHLEQQRAKEEPLSTFFSILVSSQDFYKGRNWRGQRASIALRGENPGILQAHKRHGRKPWDTRE